MSNTLKPQDYSGYKAYSTVVTKKIKSYSGAPTTSCSCSDGTGCR